MQRKEIVYSFFLHCCRETVDTFWKFVFEDLAFGKAPYGAYFARGFICCSFRGKEFSYRIDPHRPTHLLFGEVQGLLRDRLGLRSREDQRALRMKFDARARNMRISDMDDWSQVKKKEVRNLLVSSFVCDYIRDGTNIGMPGKKAYSLISLALQLKALAPEDVVLKEGRIESIRGLDKILGSDVSEWALPKTKRRGERHVPKPTEA